MKLSRNKN